MSLWKRRANYRYHKRAAQESRKNLYVRVHRSQTVLRMTKKLSRPWYQRYYHTSTRRNGWGTLSKHPITLSFSHPTTPPEEQERLTFQLLGNSFPTTPTTTYFLQDLPTSVLGTGQNPCLSIHPSTNGGTGKAPNATTADSHPTPETRSTTTATQLSW